jgi:hypothetical protein
MESSGIPKKEWLSHYDFRKAVALEWINEQENVARKRKFMELSDNDSESDSEEARSAKKKNNRSGTKSMIGSDIQSENILHSGRRVASSFKENEELELVKRRSVKVSDASLRPDGTLKKRLQRDLYHWPKPAIKPNQRCAIHRWASGIELKDKVIRCTDCEVHLCINCFQLFHMVPNLVDKKGDLRELFQKEYEEKTKSQQYTTPDKQAPFEINLNIEELLQEALTSPPV